MHDRGRVLAELTVTLADGATTISAIDTLRHQGELFGSVASDTTVWRALEEITLPGWVRLRRPGRRSERGVVSDRGPSRADPARWGRWWGSGRGDGDPVGRLDRARAQRETAGRTDL